MKSINMLENCNNSIKYLIESYTKGDSQSCVLILKSLRDLLESCMLVTILGVESKGTYDNIQLSIKQTKQNNNYYFMYKLHLFLQGTSSHHQFDVSNAKRLLFYILPNLLNIKRFIKEEKDIEILENIKHLQFNKNELSYEFYKDISKHCEGVNINESKKFSKAYYVISRKIIYIDDKVIFEYKLNNANDYYSKFNNFVCYSKEKICEHYAIRFKKTEIDLEVNKFIYKIDLITNLEYYTRPCELKNFSKLFGISGELRRKDIDYKRLMNYLNANKCNLYDIVTSDQKQFNDFTSVVWEGKIDKYLLTTFETVRKIIINKDDRYKLLLYMLIKFNNKFIKNQYSNEKLPYSNLFIRKKTYPFEILPFYMNPIKHITKLVTLFESFDSDDISNFGYQISGRIIRNISNDSNQIFVDIKNFEDPKKISDDINKLNKQLHSSHSASKIVQFSNHYYLIDNYISTKSIIDTLNAHLSDESLDNSVIRTEIHSWMKNGVTKDIDKSKIKLLCNIFKDSNVALIHGPAGTGKTYITKVISNILSDFNFYFVAHTNAAVLNLRNNINNDKYTYSTIKSLVDNPIHSDIDILVIDECSTVDNKIMFELLQQIKYKYLIMLGDIYQIDPISFGCWFPYCYHIYQKEFVYELSINHRTDCKELIDLWKHFRLCNIDKVTQILSFNDMSRKLGSDIFNIQSELDQIILCYNYDGLYGINNINKYFQSKNINTEYTWNNNSYKVDDPIIFNNSGSCSDIIENNTQGKIVDITSTKNEITFILKVFKKLEVKYYSEYFSVTESRDNYCMVKIKIISTEDEFDSYDRVASMPFHVSYAISIHKSQGLEYDCVKIIVTQEQEESIKHDIMYTAITRAKKKLLIYWENDTQSHFLKNMKLKDYKKDINLFKKLLGR